jgi:hypothetical protein
MNQSGEAVFLLRTLNRRMPRREGRRIKEFFYEKEMDSFFLGGFALSELYGLPKYGRGYPVGIRLLREHGELYRQRL